MDMGYNLIMREKWKDRLSELSLVLRDRSGCFCLFFHLLNLDGNIRVKTLYKTHDDRLKEVLSKNQYLWGAYE